MYTSVSRGERPGVPFINHSCCNCKFPDFSLPPSELMIVVAIKSHTYGSFHILIKLLRQQSMQCNDRTRCFLFSPRDLLVCSYCAMFCHFLSASVAFCSSPLSSPAFPNPATAHSARFHREVCS